MKTIKRQKLTQNLSSYLMRCVVLTRGLFEVEDDCKQNKIKLNQEVNRLKEKQKTQVARLSDPEKQLSEEKTNREKLEAMSQELKSTISKKSEGMKSIRDSNEELQISLHKAHIDVLNVCDAAFDRPKAQVLCLYPDLDLSKMGFFKLWLMVISWIWKKTIPLPLMNRARRTVMLIVTPKFQIRIR